MIETDTDIRKYCRLNKVSACRARSPFFLKINQRDNCLMLPSTTTCILWSFVAAFITGASLSCTVTGTMVATSSNLIKHKTNKVFQISLQIRTSTQKEPLANTLIDNRILNNLSLWNTSIQPITSPNSIRTILNQQIRTVNFAIGSLIADLIHDQFNPRLIGFMNDIKRILFVFAFSWKSEIVFWLSVWDLVDSEPFVCCAEETWE